MDRDQFREISRESKCNNELILTGGYYTTGILSDNITCDDVTIDIKKKDIHINRKMSHIGFMSFLHNHWYSHPELCRIRIPIKLVTLDIESTNGWEIKNRENILLPSQIKKEYEVILREEKINRLLN